MMKENIKYVGIWLIRLSLVGAAIYCGINGKTDIAYGFGVGAFLSFMFLDD